MQSAPLESSSKIRANVIGFFKILLRHFMTTTTKIFTVTELTQAIKTFLEPKFHHLTLKGEITNFTHQASGHLYFNLKDEGSQISCVLFKGVATKLSRIPKAGDKVIVKGDLSLYVPRGNYQLILSDLQYEGLGDLLIKLHESKEKFTKLGYFDSSRKKPLPKFPKTIGVVTSPTGAVIHDILNVLERRFKGFHLILNPVKVQGAGAEKEIALAIDEFNKYNLADVLIVGRGGGSLEDLWAFNEECVVEAIFRSKIPVISSVGHETDFCLADFAADVRAPTPSAAAEMAIKEKSLQHEFLTKCKKQLKFHSDHLLAFGKTRLKSILKEQVMLSSGHLLKNFIQKLDDISYDIDQSLQENLKLKTLNIKNFKKQLENLEPKAKLALYKNRKTHFQEKIEMSFIYKLKNAAAKLAHIKQLIESANPSSILKKGYCIPFAKNSNSVIISSKHIKSQETIILQFHDGKVSTQVVEGPHE